MHLGVLTKQTLEISSVVKDPTQPDPSLITEVKDSSLTILHQLLFSFRSNGKSRAQFWSVVAELGCIVLERGVRGGLQTLDSREISLLRC